MSDIHKSPDIIFNLSGFVFGNNSKKNDFVRCKSSFNLVGYISRKDATLKNPEINNTEILADKCFEVKDDWNIASYAAKRPGSAGAFCKDNNDVDNDNLRELMRKLRTTKSTVWTAVLSFTPIIGREHCSSKEQARKLIQEHLPALFKGSKLDYDNIDWFGAYHVNTQHPHIHLVFWEKQPTRFNSKGKLTYNYNNPTQKPYLPKDCLSDFKYSLAKTFDNNKLDFLSLRDKIRNSIKYDFISKDYVNLLNSLYNNDKDIINKNINQYGRLTSAEQKAINNSVDALINANPETKRTFQLYTDLLMKAHVQNIQLLKNNNMPVPERAKLFYDSRIKELRSRLGNEYLKNMKQYAALKNAINKQYNHLRPTGLSSSNFMRSVRKINKPFQHNNNSVLISLEQAVNDEIILSRNNLDKYFEELQEKGVDLIYGDERQQKSETGETFE